MLSCKPSAVDLLRSMKQQHHTLAAKPTETENSEPGLQGGLDETLMKYAARLKLKLKPVATIPSAATTTTTTTAAPTAAPTAAHNFSSAVSSALRSPTADTLAHVASQGSSTSSQREAATSATYNQGVHARAVNSIKQSVDQQAIRTNGPVVSLRSPSTPPSAKSPNSAAKAVAKAVTSNTAAVTGVTGASARSRSSSGAAVAAGLSRGNVGGGGISGSTNGNTHTPSSRGTSTSRAAVGSGNISTILNRTAPHSTTPVDVLSTSEKVQTATAMGGKTSSGHVSRAGGQSSSGGFSSTGTFSRGASNNASTLAPPSSGVRKTAK